VKTKRIVDTEDSNEATSGRCVGTTTDSASHYDLEGSCHHDNTYVYSETHHPPSLLYASVVVGGSEVQEQSEGLEDEYVNQQDLGIDEEAGEVMYSRLATAVDDDDANAVIDVDSNVYYNV